MRAAVGALLDRLRRTVVLRVDGEVGAQLLGKREFAVVDIDCADLQPHLLGVLNGEVAETAGTGDNDPFARPRLCLLEAFVGRDPGADQRRGLRGESLSGICAT